MVKKTAIHICVNCKENDDDDIALGGPKYIGFDFFINPKYEIANYIKYIKKVLQMNHIPIIGINENGRKTVHKYWSRDNILECIAHEANVYQQ